MRWYRTGKRAGGRNTLTASPPTVKAKVAAVVLTAAKSWIRYLTGAVNFVTEKRKASISGVQRQFRIGYNRAARIIEQMEARGYCERTGA